MAETAPGMVSRHFFVVLFVKLPGQLEPKCTMTASRRETGLQSLAESLSSTGEVAGRVRELLPLEAALIEGEDTQFRFHSGVPARPTG